MTNDAKVQSFTRPKRKFLPEDFTVNTWELLEPYFISLRDRNVNSLEQLQNWLKDWSELDSAFAEELSWRYIRMTEETDNKSFLESYNYSVTVLTPKASVYFNAFQNKFVALPFIKKLNPDLYGIFIRNILNEVAPLFWRYRFSKHA